MAIKLLKYDDDIVIDKVDKGNMTVIMNKKDYLEKVHEHNND